MSIDIPMSTSINNLDNIENSKINDNNIINNINLDDIIENQTLMDNNFVRYLNDNSAFEYSSKDPSVHLIGYYYCKQMINEIFPDCKNSTIITMIRFIHMLGIIFIGIGCFLPRKFLTYHILFCIHALIGWDIFDDKCYITMVVQKIKSTNKYKDFVPANMMVCRAVLLLTMLASIIGIALPQLSLFNVLTTIFDYLKNFNK
jgi:hypothetical protein